MKNAGAAKTARMITVAQHTQSDCKAWFEDVWYKHSDFCPKSDPIYGMTFKRKHCRYCGEYNDDPVMPCACVA